MQYILVTGGMGFIGSHTIVELLETNFNVIVIDNLSNSNIDVIEKIKKITNKDIIFYECDILNYEQLNNIFENYNIYCVIHFAGLKSVNESIENPLKYYHNNVSGTINLLQIMEKNNVKNFIFSSSSTVYGNTKPPFDENSETGKFITNSYGRTKFLIEEILKDLKGWNIFILRYFNPIGAHCSGLIGDNPNGIPNNLMPYIVKVAIKELSTLNIFGNDYNTLDGTPKRDFIHVVDLAKAHVKCIHCFNGMQILNLGTGVSTSVMELINTFEKTNNIKIPYEYKDKRSGDIEDSYCLADKAFEIIEWKSTKNITDMCKDSYNYVKQYLK